MPLSSPIQLEPGTTLEGLDLSRRDFRSLDLSGATFLDCCFDYATFAAVTLTGATFRQCTAYDACFLRCRFDDATLDRFWLSGAQFHECTFSRAKLDKLTRDNFPRRNLAIRRNGAPVPNYKEHIPE